MILLDANILLYAYNADEPHHPRVVAWLKQQFQRKETIGIPWLSLWAVIRIVTNARLQTNPCSLGQAFAMIDEILRMPGTQIIQPGSRHRAIAEQLAISGQASGPRFTDAVLAAMAIEHGAKLASTDRDFSRFKGLKWINPLDDAD